MTARARPLHGRPGGLRVRAGGIGACILVALLDVALALPAGATSISPLEGLFDSESLSPLDAELAGIVRSEFTRARYAEAIDALEPIVKSHPDESKAWYLLSLAYQGNSRSADALSAADRCSALAPEWQPAYWLKAKILTQTGDPAAAMRSLDQAILANPTGGWGYLERGRFRILNGPGTLEELEKAERDLRKALDLGAPPETVHGYLGIAQRKLNHPRQAEKHFHKVLEVDTTHLDAIEQLVSLYDESLRRDEATELLRRARAQLTSNGSNPSRLSALYLTEARRAISAGASSDAVSSYFAAAIKFRPGHGLTRLEFARWLDQSGQNDEAIPVLAQGLREPPYDPALAAQLAWAWTQSGQDLERARHWFAVAREAKPDDPYLGDTGAWIEYVAGNYQAALDALQESLPYADRVPEIAYHAGAIHVKLGNEGEAVRFLRLALRSGRAFSGRGEAERMLTLLEQARAS